MRLLLIGSPDYRMAQWVASLAGLGWDTHVYPASSPDQGVVAHPLLAGTTFWDTTGVEVDRPEREVRVRPANALGLRPWPRCVGRGRSASWTLAALIRRLKPDVVHSFQVQDAGLATLDARERLGSARMPYWIHTSYGGHGVATDPGDDLRSRITRLMRAIDVHIADCTRDLDLGVGYGYAGPRLKVIPIGGGWDLAALEALRSPGSPSARRTITVKSSDGELGRGSSELGGLTRAADALGGYSVALCRASGRFAESVMRLGRRNGFSVERVGDPIRGSASEELLLHGRSRLCIDLAVRQGIAISTLEAMVMGSLPIQSDTACQREWITDGMNGLLVPPGDPQAMADAIRLAVTDDALVDHAATVNARVARERLAFPVVLQQVVSMYEEAYATARERRA